MREFDLIARYFAPLSAGFDAAHSLTDDAAFLLPPTGKTQVITADAMVEGVHFLPADPADLVARKLLRVNLSDLAAKGAAPACYFLTCAFSNRVDEGWIARFCDGLATDQGIYGIHLAGGDTVSTSGPLTFSLTAVGYADAPLFRSGAQAGDDLYVTGTLGDAWLGLKRLQAELPDWAGAEDAVRRYRLPEPRTAFGPLLQGLASAAMDVSDGLMADLGHLCRASRVGADVSLEMLPLSESARNACAAWELRKEAIVSRGDDYEILFAAPPSARTQVETLAAQSATAVTRIGVVTPGQAVRLLGTDGQEITLPKAGYEHFSGV